jgi:precorrin-6y C5,15-methyltransferase (decarboxylating) CbiE subunit
MHRVLIISTGPGGRDYITKKAIDKAKECDVIIGAGFQLNSIEISREQIVIEESNIEEILELIKSHEGQKIGLLVIGDAGIYSLSQKVGDLFGKDAVEEIVPGVSSIQTAFARLKETWLNVQVFSFRNEPLEGLKEIFRYERVAILCDRENTSKVILSGLANLGLFEGFRRIYVCQDLTLENEHVVEIRDSEDIERISVGRREIILLME